MQAPHYHLEGYRSGWGLCNVGIRLHGRSQRCSGATSISFAHSPLLPDQRAGQGGESSSRESLEGKSHIFHKANAKQKINDENNCRDPRLKHPVRSTGWSQPRPRGPILPAVYTVSMTSSLLIFLRNISCPCPVTRVTRLSSRPHPLLPSSLSQPWLIPIMAFLDCCVAPRGKGNYKWQGNFRRQRKVM